MTYTIQETGPSFQRAHKQNFNSCKMKGKKEGMKGKGKEGKGRNGSKSKHNFLGVDSNGDRRTETQITCFVKSREVLYAIVNQPSSTANQFRNLIQGHLKRPSYYYFYICTPKAKKGAEKHVREKRHHVGNL